MATWAEFATAAPELAAAGRQLFYQYGIGLGYLATVRSDGAPRVHPICPLLVGEGLYAFLVPSPKRDDLVRDGRYALHTYPNKDTDDEFCVMGRAGSSPDPAVRAAAVAAYHIPVPDDHQLFEFHIQRAMHAKYRHRGAWPPTYTVWRAASGSRRPRRST